MIREMEGTSLGLQCLKFGKPLDTTFKERVLFTLWSVSQEGEGQYPSPNKISGPKTVHSQHAGWIAYRAGSSS
jgi:hypothetical protein